MLADNQSQERELAMWQGNVESLHIVAEKSQPMATVESVQAVAGRGLDGDRYASGKGTYSEFPEEGRQVTLFEQETLVALRRESRRSLGCGRYIFRGHRPVRGCDNAVSPAYIGTPYTGCTASGTWLGSTW